MLHKLIELPTARLAEADGYAALCGRLEGDIYYSLVLKYLPDYEAIRCA